MSDIRVSEERINAAVAEIQAVCVKQAHALCGEWSMWARLMVAERLAERAASKLQESHGG